MYMFQFRTIPKIDLGKLLKNSEKSFNVTYVPWKFRYMNL